MNKAGPARAPGSAHRNARRNAHRNAHWDEWTFAISKTERGTFLYAANFSDGTVDVFDSSLQQVNSFTDPGLQHDYAPCEIQVLDGKLFVTFVRRNSANLVDAVEPEHGFIDEFDFDGTMLDQAEFRPGRR
jgi:DNA-binding beta-propeller fold protein YncE